MKGHLGRRQVSEMFHAAGGYEVGNTKERLATWALTMPRVSIMRPTDNSRSIRPELRISNGYSSIEAWRLCDCIGEEEKNDRQSLTAQSRRDEGNRSLGASKSWRGLHRNGQRGREKRKEKILVCGGQAAPCSRELGHKQPPVTKCGA